MKKYRKSILLILLAAILFFNTSLQFSAESKIPESFEDIENIKDLKLIMLRSPFSRKFHPLFAENSADMAICRMIYPTLMLPDGDGSLEPSYAISCKIEDYGRRAVFKLRSDMKWQDGMPVTSQDVAYSISALAHPSVPYRFRSPVSGIYGYKNLYKEFYDELEIKPGDPGFYGLFHQLYPQIPDRGIHFNLNPAPESFSRIKSSSPEGFRKSFFGSYTVAASKIYTSADLPESRKSSKLENNRIQQPKEKFDINENIDLPDFEDYHNRPNKPTLNFENEKESRPFYQSAPANNPYGEQEFSQQESTAKQEKGSENIQEQSAPTTEEQAIEESREREIFPPYEEIEESQESETIQEGENATAEAEGAEPSETASQSESESEETLDDIMNIASIADIVDKFNPENLRYYFDNLFYMNKFPPYVQLLKGIETPDDDTVVINFETGSMPDLYFLQTFPIFPRHIWQTLPPEFWGEQKSLLKNPQGAGRFKLINLQSDEILLLPNEEYTGVPVKSPVLLRYNSNDDAVEDLLSSEIYAAEFSELSPEDIDNLIDAGFSINAKAMNLIHMLGFNCGQNSLLADPYLRNAIAGILKQSDYLQAMAGGLADFPDTLAVPGSQICQSSYHPPYTTLTGIDITALFLKAGYKLSGNEIENIELEGDDKDQKAVEGAGEENTEDAGSGESAGNNTELDEIEVADTEATKDEKVNEETKTDDLEENLDKSESTVESQSENTDFDADNTELDENNDVDENAEDGSKAQPATEENHVKNIENQLLDAEGKQLELRLFYTNKNPYYTRVAEIIKTVLGHRGIKVSAQVMSPQELADAVLLQHDYDMLLWQLDLSEEPDFEEFLHSKRISREPGFYSHNFLAYSSNSTDSAISDLNVAVDNSERRLLYQKICRNFSKDLPAMPLFIPQTILVAPQNAESVSEMIFAAACTDLEAKDE